MNSNKFTGSQILEHYQLEYGTGDSEYCVDIVRKLYSDITVSTDNNSIEIINLLELQDGTRN